MPPQKRERDLTCDFDFNRVLQAIDGTEATDIDAQFWALEGALLNDILLWVSEAKTLAGRGARLTALCVYLRPGLVTQDSLRAISRMGPEAPSRAALSKALLTWQAKYLLPRGCFQKPGWSREVFSRSRIASHQQKAQ